MRPGAPTREEGAFEVGPEYPRARRGAPARLRDPRGRASQLLDVTGDQRRLIRDDAVARERVTHEEDLIDVRVQEVDAEVAVDLCVDEPRNRDAVSAAGQSHGDDLPGVDGDVA